MLGKHSGRAGFRNALQELGIRLDDEQMQRGLPAVPGAG